MKKRLCCLVLALLMTAALIPLPAAAVETDPQNLSMTAEETVGTQRVMSSPGSVKTDWLEGFMIRCQCTDNLTSSETSSGSCYEIQYRKDGGAWQTGGYIYTRSSDYDPWYPSVYIPLPAQNYAGVYEFRNRKVSVNSDGVVVINESAPWAETTPLWVVPPSAGTAERTAEGVRFVWNAVAGAEGYRVQRDEAINPVDDSGKRSIWGDPDRLAGRLNLTKWETLAELPNTQTSYLHRINGFEDRRYQIVAYKRNPYSGGLVYTNLGVNCYGTYDWMPAPTNLTATATSRGVLLSWTASPDSPYKEFDETTYYEKQSNQRHYPDVVYQVERSEDGGATWSQDLCRSFFEEDSTLTYFLDTETRVGKTYTYRVTAYESLMIWAAGPSDPEEMKVYLSYTYTSPATEAVSVTCDVAAQVIAAANCTVTVPADGNHPDLTAKVDANAPYTVRLVGWWEEGLSDRMTESGVFVAGKKYDVRLEFSAKPGYVFDENTKLTVNGKTALGPFNSLTYCGYQFVADGWSKLGGKWVYYKDNGLARGWVKDGGKWYYLEGNSGMVTGWKKVGGKWYYLDTNGVMVTGWKQVSGKWYYMDTSGAMQTGKVQIGSLLYTFGADGAWDGKTGVKNGWIKTSAGKWTYYREGVLQKGWQKLSGKWYYLGTDGVMVTGWKQISGKWYYMDTSGVMQTGRVQIDSLLYTFGSDGVWNGKAGIRNGWIRTSAGKWTYYREGTLLKGWQQLSGKWYYLGTDGVMATGWKQVSGKWYYLGSDGVMRTGWQKISGIWYCLDAGGAMKTGWYSENGKWYYFKTSGAMACNETLSIGGKRYTFNANGVWVS